MQFVHPMLKVAAIERTALDTEGSRRNQDSLRSRLLGLNLRRPHPAFFFPDGPYGHSMAMTKCIFFLKPRNQLGGFHIRRVDPCLGCMVFQLFRRFTGFQPNIIDVGLESHLKAMSI
jgi:hypothetical protein